MESPVFKVDVYGTIGFEVVRKNLKKEKKEGGLRRNFTDLLLSSFFFLFIFFYRGETNSTKRG